MDVKYLKPICWLCCRIVKKLVFKKRNMHLKCFFWLLPNMGWTQFNLQLSRIQHLNDICQFWFIQRWPQKETITVWVQIASMWLNWFHFQPNYQQLFGWIAQTGHFQLDCQHLLETNLNQAKKKNCSQKLCQSANIFLNVDEELESHVTITLFSFRKNSFDKINQP